MILDLIKITQYKINFSAASCGIEPDWECVLIEDHVPYYVVMVGLGVPLFSTRIYKGKEAQEKLDKLFDEVYLHLCSIKMEIHHDEFEGDKLTVYYNFDWEDEEAPNRIITINSSDIHDLPRFVTDDTYIVELVKDKLRNRYLDTIDA